MEQKVKIFFKNKRVLIIPAVVLGLIIGAFLYCYQNDSAGEGPYLEIDALNVGKADCLIITDGDHTILIDTATADMSSGILARLQELHVSKIDLMIITHYDKDHIGSAPYIVKNFTIEELVMPDYLPEDSERLERLMELPTKNKPKLIAKPYTVQIGPIRLDIRPCIDSEKLIAEKIEKNKEFDNDQSLVTMLTFEGKNFLFTGDIEKDRCKELLEDDSFSLKADWIKMPEHGRYQKKLPDLIEQVNPTYAVISTSNEEQPSDKTLKLLKEHNIAYYGTYDGDIVTICNNRSVIEVNAKKS
ncbi:MAG: MBL fold metallo-hydrolase [Lachnospiraceae bacterium]|nr:MBL fold metallo-hydrolase [Lachnospiraceae bacterium]